MDFEKLKDFTHKGYLPKEIANCKSPLCSFYIQAKQQQTSASHSAIGGSIKSGDLKPEIKISCNQYQSSKKDIIANNNGQILLKTFATCSTLFVDYAFDFIFNFTQTSTKAS